MNIAEIINEIDAYLVRLCNARNLLVAPMGETRSKTEPRHKNAVRASKTGRPSSSKPGVHENKSKFDRMAAPVTRSKQHMDSPSRVRNSIDPQVAVSAQNPQQDLRIERLPTPDRETPSTRTERRPVTKEALATTMEYSKPAVALAGPVRSRIVVVSAEQVQREREAVARSAVHRPRVPAIGLTGRAALEALFNDGSDTSKTTRD